MGRDAPVNHCQLTKMVSVLLFQAIVGLFGLSVITFLTSVLLLTPKISSLLISYICMILLNNN